MTKPQEGFFAAIGRGDKQGLLALSAEAGNGVAERKQESETNLNCPRWVGAVSLQVICERP